MCTLNPNVEISLTILLSSKEVACWDTFDAAILASAKVPDVILDADKFGISASVNPPLIKFAKSLAFVIIF